ncbi:uncharacterized protein LOC124368488 [Homalodisca vitripennis]|uniref:uncharacterized protein LOC124368488 n=1 Tax=Homalodisca vitripennis TaxID=197043 RepID=UPI001EEA5C2E|nr:uncharacterized protein LOC124368488 [Homalodisca vitripennis]KAG8290877.1 hypothetical protein J6590_073798 [Homalodisca vitripennis]
MMFKKLIFFCLVVAIVRSDTTEEVSSSIETPPTTSSIDNPTLEELKKHGANPKNKGVSLRSSDSLFGLGIGANLPIYFGTSLYTTKKKKHYVNNVLNFLFEVPYIF